jgi:hypothetical protein
MASLDNKCHNHHQQHLPLHCPFLHDSDVFPGNQVSLTQTLATMPFYYEHHGKEAPNMFVRFWRKVYNPLGFKKGYNFPLWFIFCGAALGFCASRAMFLNYDHAFKEGRIISGEWLHLSHGLMRVGALLHLAAVIPIGFMLPLQFLPIVRYKFILAHRVMGYILIILLLLGNVGAIIMAPQALGGSIDVQTMIGVLAIMTTGSALLAYINIKRLQIDQHRAWMIRCWAYAFIIITQRIIQVPVMTIISARGGTYVPMSCETIDYINQQLGENMAAHFFPGCAEDPKAVMGVLANINAGEDAEGLPLLHEIGASIRCAFGPSVFLAIAIHAILVEIYLHLTGAEAARLKRVSYEKQKAKGWSRPGDASWLTKEIWGDMEPFDYKQGVSDIQAKLDNSNEEPVERSSQ